MLLLGQLEQVQVEAVVQVAVLLLLPVHDLEPLQQRLPGQEQEHRDLNQKRHSALGPGRQQVLGLRHQKQRHHPCDKTTDGIRQITNKRRANCTGTTGSNRVALTLSSWRQQQKDPMSVSCMGERQCRRRKLRRRTGTCKPHR